MRSVSFFVELTDGIVSTGFYSHITAAGGQLGNRFINSSKKIINVQFYECLPSFFIYMLCVCMQNFREFFFFNPLLQARELRLRKAKAGKLTEVPWVVSRMEMGGCLPECNVESPVPVPGIA